MTSLRSTRAEQTGRDVPEHLIVKSLESVASSLNILMPLADFVARINNDHETPELRAYIRVNPDGNWEHIRSQFARPETSGSFPSSMAPMLLVSVGCDVVRSVPPGPRAGETTDRAHLRARALAFSPRLGPTSVFPSVWGGVFRV